MSAMGQLHHSLQVHPKIVSMENTDIRKLENTRLPGAPGYRGDRRQLHLAEGGAGRRACHWRRRRCTCFR